MVLGLGAMVVIRYGTNIADTELQVNHVSRATIRTYHCLTKK